METIFGKAFDLPLVKHLGTLKSHKAQLTKNWHTHEGFELIFVVNGGTVWEFQDGTKIDISGGHFLVIPPLAVHRVERAMRGPSTICGLVFNPKCRNGWKNTTFTRQDLRWLNGRFTQSGFVVTALSDEFITRVNRLITLKQMLEGDPENLLVRASLRTLACSVILGAASEITPSRTEGPTALVAAAKKYLSQHLHEQVPMSNLVRHMGFSRSYLFAIFKSVTGMTPNDYYLRLRVDVAQQMLVGSSHTITTIAMDTGFSSSQYFSSVFRKYTGQTPMEYRQKSQPRATPPG